VGQDVILRRIVNPPVFAPIANRRAGYQPAPHAETEGISNVFTPPKTKEPNPAMRIVRNALLMSTLALTAHAAPSYFLTTFAGYFPPLGAPLALNQPPLRLGQVVYDSHGVLYYADSLRIWRLNADGTETHIAGSYSPGSQYQEGGPAINTTFQDIVGFVIDSQENIYIAENFYQKVYKVTPDGAIRTFAGTGSYVKNSPPYVGQGIPAAMAQISPNAIAIDANDNVYIWEENDTKKSGYKSAVVSFPPDGGSSNLVGTTPIQYLADMAISGSTLFLVTTTAAPAEMDLTTGAYTAIQGSIGQQLAAGPGGYIYAFTGNGNGPIVKVNLQTLAVQPIPGTNNLAGNALAVNPLTGDIAIANGNVRILNVSSASTQIVAANPVPFSGDNGPAILAAMQPGNLAADAAGNIYVADAGNCRIRKIDLNGIINTIAGNGTCGSTGDGGPALQAEVNPGELAFDGAGNLYFINSGYPTSTIRKIDSTGMVITVAGGGAGTIATGASGTSVAINASHLAADSSGNLYFEEGAQLYEMDPSGSITLLAGSNKSGTVQDGATALDASIGYVITIAVDPLGSVYFGDFDNQVIWRLDSQGILHVAAGVISNTFYNRIPAGPATQAYIGDPYNLVFDSGGNFYFWSDNFSNNEQVVRVDASGNLTPLAGGGTKAPAYFSWGPGSTGDGGDASLGTFAFPNGLAVDPHGNLFVSDGGFVIREMAIYNPENLPPFLTAGGVVGAGGSVPAVEAVSPGGMASIFGANFISAANQHTVGSADLINGKVPTRLEGVCVSIGSMAAAMLGVYPSQINVQVGALPPGPVTVQVTTGCGTSNAVTSNYAGVAVQAASPEFFYYAIDPTGGSNPVAAANTSTGAKIGPPGLLPGVTLVPAKPGDTVEVYATGFGATSPSFGLGAIPGKGAMVAAPYSLTLGGVPIPASDIAYAGVSPCCVGLYQLDFTIPAGTPSGQLPLVITIAGAPSPSEAYLEVQ
jgi:uncharacterized protein (TIGR03437 family)